MALLQAKPEKTAVVGVRVAVSLRDLLSGLREEAERYGYDLSATLAEALQRAAKQIRAELDDAQAKAVTEKPAQHVNGTSSSKADA